MHGQNNIIVRNHLMVVFATINRLDMFFYAIKCWANQGYTVNWFSWVSMGSIIFIFF